MAVPEQLRDLAAGLNRRFSEHISIHNVIAGRDNGWYGRSLTEIVLLVEGEEVVYTTATHDAEAGEARFLVVTETSIIDTAVAGTNESSSTIRSTAYARKSIVQLGVSATASAFSDEYFSMWPGEMAITVKLSNSSVPAVFPLERRMNGDQEGPLRELLASFKVDLTK